MALTDLAIRKLCPKAKSYRITDERGLSIQVTTNGAKYWRFRYSHLGRERLLALGVYPTVNLKQARIKRDEALQMLAEGRDPMSERRKAKERVRIEALSRFSVVAEAWFEFNRPKWSQATCEKVRHYMGLDMLPRLGNKLIFEIGPADTAAVIERMERRGAFNASKKVRQWLRRIFSYAIAKGLTTTNPASDLKEIAAKAPAPQHHAYLREHELPEFLRALQAYGGREIFKTAAMLVILTASRPGAVRIAAWSEFDLDEGLWQIPAANMKMRRPHIVPLPRQAIALLRDLHMLTGHTPTLFRGQGGYGRRAGLHISEGTINQCFARIGYKGRMTGHGARHTASTLLHEHGWDSRLIDAQLSHLDPMAPKIRGQYNHALYLPQRREMMQWYADHLDKLVAGEVVPEDPSRRPRRPMGEGLPGNELDALYE